VDELRWIACELREATPSLGTVSQVREADVPSGQGWAYEVELIDGRTATVQVFVDD